ncbi:hypothetical protein G9F72_020230 [Clostridium estertheticum]|uniref:hypothetical protein n=1 Tax=Clostridium estertheticum TaxID=238834 RepID=UPI0013E8F671|nr:hypothetical protein [Clostridium estertheticum]MBZ9688655.1 hypothetical protein [Clostridium estertheticum]
MSVKFSREYYGWDRFSKITLILGIFLFVTGYAWILGTALIIYSIWRSKSTKLQGRNNKRFVFESTKRGFDRKMNNFKKNIKLINIVKNVELLNAKIKKYNPMEKLKERRKYIITSCPKCRQKLRLPKGKGKIIVTCSKCSSEFRLKT